MVGDGDSDGDHLSGRVEVFHEGVWGTVCDHSWGNLDAQVVCRSLGLTGGVAHVYARYGAGTGKIHMDNVRCRGDEGSIFYCSRKSENINCRHYDDASVTCSGMYVYCVEKTNIVI